MNVKMTGIIILTILLLVSSTIAEAGTIGACGVTISTPGTYTVSTDITDNTHDPCILVTSSDVTIDGGGHTINGVDARTGILSYNPQTALSRVNIRNLRLSDWSQAIRYRATIDSEIRNNYISSSTYGVYFDDYSGRNKFIGNNFISNSNALYILTGYNNFTRNILDSNNNGFYLYRSDYNIFNDNTGTKNGNTFYLVYADNNTLNRNTAINDNPYLGGYGFYLSNSNDNVLNDNKAVQSYGFYLQSSNRNMLNNNNGSDSNYGFYLSNSNNNTLKSGVANTKQHGIYLYSSESNTIIRNTVKNVPTYYYGIYVYSSNNNNIYDNLFNNINNWYIYNSVNNWNRGQKVATNIVNGMYTAGNVWEKPDGLGLSQVCSDVDRNGICDTIYPLDVNNKDNLPLVHHADSTIPKSVTNLHNTTYQNNYIKWVWTDPTDIDFSYAKIYINGVFKTGVLHGSQTYNATGLLPNVAYTIGVRTVDINGNQNVTIRTHTAKTKPDSIPPGIVSGLHNTTYLQTSINWVWTDPANYDLQYIKVWIDGTFKASVPKGIQKYNAIGLSAGANHIISTRAIDTSGNLGAWKNNTVRTKP